LYRRRNEKMFCKNCGYQNEGNAAFCKECGAPLPAHANPQKQAVVNSVNQQAGWGGYSPGIDTYKTICKSPLSMAAMIAYSVAALFSLIGSIRGLSASNRVFNMMYGIGSFAGANTSGINAISSAWNGAQILIIIVTFVPAAILAAGLWVNYVYVLDRQGTGVKTTGLTMIKISVIISFVIICISLVVAVIGSFIVLAVGLSGNDNTALVAIIVVLIIAAIIFLYIFYNIKLIKTINTIKMTVITGAPSDEVSIFVAIICFISCIGLLLSLFYGDAFSKIAILCNIAAEIMFGILIFTYRSKMQVAMSGGNPPLVSPVSKIPTGSSPVPPINRTQVSSAQVPPVTRIPANPYNTPPRQVQVNPVPPVSSGDFTTSLGNGAYQSPVLIRLKTNETIRISKQSFRLGKERGSVDYCVSDNSAVSREHACVICNNGRYYISDLNSKNGTYIDGRIVNPGSKMEIRDKSKLVLANEEFIFRILQYN